jgi:uncharacterized protein (TIGR02145 family)
VHSDNDLDPFTGYRSESAGKYLKAETGWTSSDGIVNDDKYGFSALPGGYVVNNTFYGIGTDGNWWTASASSGYPTQAYISEMVYNNQQVELGNPSYKSYLLSVRCVMD